MTQACPGGSTGRSRASLRLPFETASLRAGATRGLPGQAAAADEQRLIVAAGMGRSSMPLDNPGGVPCRAAGENKARLGLCPGPAKGIALGTIHLRRGSEATGNAVATSP